MIDTMDKLVAAVAQGQKFTIQKLSTTSVANNWNSLWDAAGNPGAGAMSIGNTTAGVVPTDATAGAPKITDFTGGNAGHLGDWTINIASTGTQMLYDRLWHAGSFACSSLTTFTITAPPSIAARLPATNYGEVEIWLEVNAANGATNTIVSVTYTNEAGDTGHTATHTGQFANLASFITRRMVRMDLQAGDKGVQKIESVIVSGATGTMTFNVVLLRRLATTCCISSSTGPAGGPMDAFKLGLPRIFSDSCLALMICPTSTATGGCYTWGTIIQG